MNNLGNAFITISNGLKDYLENIVFVGGSCCQFYVDSSLAGEARPTEDIDCIIEIASRARYYQLEEYLRALGFKNDTSLLCRWNYCGVTIDIMPIDSAILGFTNSWYKHAFDNIEKVSLTDDVSINILQLPCYLCSKFEACFDRGMKDLRLSSDLEDIFYVINGCDPVLEIIEQSDKLFQEYLSESFSYLLERDDFEDIFSAHSPERSRAGQMMLREKMEKIIQLN